MSRGRQGPRQPGGGRQQAGPRGRGKVAVLAAIATSGSKSERKSARIPANPICA